MTFDPHNCHVAFYIKSCVRTSDLVSGVFRADVGCGRGAGTKADILGAPSLEE